MNSQSPEAYAFGDFLLLGENSMDRKTIVRIAGYLTLAAMAVSIVFYCFGPIQYAAPAIIVLLFSSWLHGICWGRLYSLEGRLTWF